MQRNCIRTRPAHPAAPESEHPTPRVESLVQVRDEAVGESTDRRSFIQYENDVVSGFGHAPEGCSPGKATETVVDVVTLSDAVESSIDMIKIDVEGFEPEVLRGATGLFDRSPGAVALVELNPRSLQEAGHSVDELMDFFPTDRWALWLVDDDLARTPDGIRQWGAITAAFVKGADPQWYGNLLAVPVVRAEEVNDLIDDPR